MGKARDRIGALNYLAEAGYAPLPWQQRFHLAGTTDARLRAQKLAVCGLGSGKTEAGIWEGVMLALLNPGCRGVVTAPTYDLLEYEIRQRWSEAMEQMAEAGLPLSKRWHQTAMYDELWCGGRVFFRSLSKVHNLRGRQFAWAWMDEIESTINPTLVWDVLSGRVRQAGSNVREAFGTSTPRGLRGTIELFVQNRQKAKAAETFDVNGVAHIRQRVRGRDVLVPRDQALKSWFTIRATSEDNPYLGDDYFAAMTGYSKRRWEEEVEAKILQPETAVWPEFDTRVHGIDFPRPWVMGRDGRMQANPKWNATIPVDLTYDAGDSYPHALWIAELSSNVSVIVDEYCEDGKPLGVVHDAIVQRQQFCRRGPDHIVGDRAVPSELGWLMDTFPRAVPHKMVRRVEQDVLTGIEVVRERASPMRGEPKLLIANHLIDDAERSRRGIWNCVKRYRFRQNADGTLQSSPWKDGVYDHGCDALRMHQVARYGRDTLPRFYSIGRTW
jgi:hypothetical protein